MSSESKPFKSLPSTELDKINRKIDEAAIYVNSRIGESPVSLYRYCERAKQKIPTQLMDSIVTVSSIVEAIKSTDNSMTTETLHRSAQKGLIVGTMILESLKGKKKRSLIEDETTRHLEVIEDNLATYPFDLEQLVERDGSEYAHHFKFQLQLNNLSTFRSGDRLDSLTRSRASALFSNAVGFMVINGVNILLEHEFRGHNPIDTDAQIDLGRQADYLANHEISQEDLDSLLPPEDV